MTPSTCITGGAKTQPVYDTSIKYDAFLGGAKTQSVYDTSLNYNPCPGRC